MPRRTTTRTRPRAAGEQARRLRPRRRPLQARARRRVDRILEVTARLLEQRDLEALTTAEIALRARVPIGSVYQYFPSKEAILAELAGRKFQAVDTAFAAAFARDLERVDWRRALERTLDLSVNAFRSDPAYMTVWKTTRSSPSFRSVAADYDERFALALEAVPLVSRLPAARRRVAVRAAIRIANAFLDWILETPDARQATAIAREMRRTLISYLAPDLDPVAKGR